MNAKLARLQTFIARVRALGMQSHTPAELVPSAAIAALDLTELVDSLVQRAAGLEQLLGRLYLRVTQTLTEPARLDSAVLVEIATMIEAVAVGGAPATADAVTLSPGASPTDQVAALLRLQEWTRIPGVGFRCPICLASRSRGHRAACWLRQARLLLTIGGRHGADADASPPSNETGATVGPDDHGGRPVSADEG